MNFQIRQRKTIKIGITDRQNTAYRLINLIFVGIILCVISYSVVFNPDKNNYPIHSYHSKVTGQPSISTGLSRSFSAIVRLDFDAAHKYNQYGTRLFAFFLIQLIFRILLYLAQKLKPWDLRRIIYPDAVVSAALFIIFFWPFIVDLVG